MTSKRVLIFRTGHLGDTVVALPSLWAIRRHYSDARVSLLTNIDVRNPQYISPADVLPRACLIDEVIAYPNNPGKFAMTRALASLALRLRQKRFDSAFYLMPRVRSEGQIRRDRAFFRLAGVGYLKGLAFLQANRLEYAIDFPAPSVEPEFQFLLRMLNDAGISSESVETDLLLSEEELSAAEEWLSASTPNADLENLIAVAPGAKFDFKCWDEKKYLEVVSRLIQQRGCYPIVFGGSEDKQKGDRLLKAWGTGANAAGALRVRESAALLGKCKLYLGNDTGTMHLAAAMAVPCVAIFSSMDRIGRWSPVGSGHRIIRSESHCRGCLDLDTGNIHTCVSSIGVEEVQRATFEVVDRF